MASSEAGDHRVFIEWGMVRGRLLDTVGARDRVFFFSPLLFVNIPERRASVYKFEVV